MVSIYEAEIRGKPGAKTVEDQLTSRVFGALAMLPKETVLLPFLKKLTSEDVKSAKISLWPYIDDTRPDICIETPSSLIVIEAKTDAKPGKEQLKSQFREAHRKAGKRKKLTYFLLTKDDQSKVARDAQDELKEEFRDTKVRVHWRSWTQVWKWLREIRKEAKKSIGDTSYSLLDATLKLLEARHMNIKGPTGFIKEWFKRDVIDALDKVEDLYYEIHHTIPHVVQKAAEERGIVLLGESVWGTQEYKYETNEHKWQLKTKTSLPRYFEYYFKDDGWAKVESKEDPSLYIYFGLGHEEDTDDYLGVGVAFWWPCPSKEEAEEEMEKEAQELRSKWGLQELKIERDDGNIIAYRPFNFDSDFRQLEEEEQVVETLVEELDKMRRFANGLKSLENVLKGRIRRKKGK